MLTRVSFFELRPGIRLGGYELVRWIGGGGQGQVWEADAGQGRVALKVMTPGGDQRARERFATELVAARAIDSTYVAQPVDWDPAGGWIAYERVVGSPLAVVLAQEEVQLPLQRALDVLTDIAAGVVAIHEQGLTHCDLKPSNVLVTPRDRAKVLDLGAVSMGTRSELSVEYGVATPEWAAPEQGFGPVGDGPVTPAADVHALGLLIVKTVTGHGAYSARYPSGSPDLRGMPASLVHLVHACLRVKPKGRPPADWVFAQLRRLRDDLRAETAGEPAPQPGRRRPVAWPVLARIEDVTFRTDGIDGELLADAALEPTPCAGTVITHVVLRRDLWHVDAFDHGEHVSGVVHDFWQDTSISVGSWAELQPSRFGSSAARASPAWDARPASPLSLGEWKYASTPVVPPKRCPSCNAELSCWAKRDPGGLSRRCPASETCPPQVAFAIYLFVRRLTGNAPPWDLLLDAVADDSTLTLHSLLVSGADDMPDLRLRESLTAARTAAATCTTYTLLRALRAPWIREDASELNDRVRLEDLLADPPVVAFNDDHGLEQQDLARWLRRAEHLKAWARRPDRRALLLAVQELRETAGYP